METNSIFSEVPFEQPDFELAQVANGSCAEGMEFLLRDFADTGQTSDRQGSQEGLYFLRLKDEQAVGVFFQSEAILARKLFGATPAEAVRWISLRICSRIVRATKVAVGRPVLFSVTSRYAPSRDRGSMRSV